MWELRDVWKEMSCNHDNDMDTKCNEILIRKLRIRQWYQLGERKVSSNTCSLTTCCTIAKKREWRTAVQRMNSHLTIADMMTIKSLIVSDTLASTTKERHFDEWWGIIWRIETDFVMVKKDKKMDNDVYTFVSVRMLQCYKMCIIMTEIQSWIQGSICIREVSFSADHRNALLLRGWGEDIGGINSENVRCYVLLRDSHIVLEERLQLLQINQERSPDVIIPRLERPPIETNQT